RLAAEAAADRAVQAQGRAEQGFAKAKEAVEHYLKAVTNDPDLKYKHDLHALRKKLLKAAVPFYQWFTEQKPGEAALEAERGRTGREGRAGRDVARLAPPANGDGENERPGKGLDPQAAILPQAGAPPPRCPRLPPGPGREPQRPGRCAEGPGAAAGGRAGLP